MRKLMLVLLCVVGDFSAHISPRRFLQRPQLLAGKSRNAKIVGGNEATPHSIPYQVGLDFDGTFCGGTLITSRHVLTSASCAKLSSRPKVILGAHRIEENEPSQIILIGHKVIIHEQFGLYTYEHDIAIVELPEEVPLDDNINIIPIIQSNATDFTGENVTASGWGLSFDGASTNSPVLRVFTTTVLSLTECRHILYYWTIPDGVMCTEVIERQNVCNGDNGGPLTAKVNDETVLIGTIMFHTSVNGCETDDRPSFSTRLSNYVDWIQEKVSNVV